MAELDLDYDYLAKLVRKTQTGDSNAFAELYTATYQKQYRFTYQYVKDPYLAQDVLQDVYILVLKKIHTLKNPRLFVMKRTDDVIGHYKSGNPIYRRTQRYPAATKGETLMKACKTMQKKYGVEFVFCSNSEQGAKVIELLQREVE